MSKGRELRVLQASQLYDTLFAEASEIIRVHNPCEVQTDANGKVTCLSGRSGSFNFCCGGCPHLGPKGCTVQALWCRTWTCHTLWEKKPEVVRLLRAVEKKAWSGPFYGIEPYRASKEECMVQVRTGEKLSPWR